MHFWRYPLRETLDLFTRGIEISHDYGDNQFGAVVARDGDEVIVEPGTYYAPGSGNNGYSLTIDKAVTLRSVSVGGIRVENVQATVLEGDFPSTILLGMTYLQHVDMEENNGVLSLSRDW